VHRGHDERADDDTAGSEGRVSHALRRLDPKRRQQCVHKAWLEAIAMRVLVRPRLFLCRASESESDRVAKYVSADSGIESVAIATTRL
jgi:hypothetical protein